MNLNNLAVLFIWVTVVPMHVLSQQFGIIQGKVIDGETSKPVPGANVIFIDKTRGVITDQAGFYSMNRVSPGVYILQTSSIGYDLDTTYAVSVHPDEVDTIDIQLYPTGTREAFEDIGNRKIQIRVYGLVIRTIPDTIENVLTDKYGFRNIYTGCVIIDGDLTYNRIMRKYLDSLNGVGWEHKFNTEFNALSKQYKPEPADN